jgi:hypothetical protein
MNEVESELNKTDQHLDEIERENMKLNDERIKFENDLEKNQFSMRMKNMEKTISNKRFNLMKL